jgi:hypothetical protein
MFFGLIFRASGKSKRSILSWREEKKTIIPTSVRFGDKSDASTLGSSKTGYGFGRQGEKAAVRNGKTILLLRWNGTDLCPLFS